MNILDRYIAVSLIKTTVLALLSLMLILLLFTVIDEIGLASKLSYSLWHAPYYALLTAPHMASELFPIATVIGSMTTLGLLAKNNELAIIRTSGISQVKLAWILCKGGTMLIFLSLLISEVITPYAEKNNQYLRSLTTTQQISLKTKYGFWAKDEQTFINVRQVFSNHNFADVHIYEFDNQQKLISNSIAERAEYQNGQWLLEHIKYTQINPQKISTEALKHINWDVSLNPSIADSIIIKPQFLSLTDLYDHINYLQRNGQNSKIYERVFWSKIMSPVFILIMILLAVPIIKVHSKKVFDQRIFLGCMAGIALNILNQIIAHLTIVYQLSVALGIILPILLTLAILIGLLHKHKNDPKTSIV